MMGNVHRFAADSRMRLPGILALLALSLSRILD